ncbi:MAG: RnfABCDGE type electron transport complex subunit G [Vallitaleaceae bacterium]|nr:RnfABCDGE type electron transport complex subunit G [Vallitaleaceae bacterium]
MKKDSTIKNALILFSITLIAGILLAVTYGATANARAEQELLKTNNGLQAVLPNSSFNEVDVLGENDYILSVFEGNSKEDGSGDLTGYAFLLETTEGYGDAIRIMAAVNAEGLLNGIDIIKHTETPGLGAKADEDGFKVQFVGKATELLEVVKGSSDGQNIDAIGGATITSKAVTKAVNEAIEYYQNNLKEGNE